MAKTKMVGAARQRKQDGWHEVSTLKSPFGREFCNQNLMRGGKVVARIFFDDIWEKWRAFLIGSNGKITRELRAGKITGLDSGKKVIEKALRWKF